MLVLLEEGVAGLAARRTAHIVLVYGAILRLIQKVAIALDADPGRRHLLTDTHLAPRPLHPLRIQLPHLQRIQVDGLLAHLRLRLLSVLSVLFEIGHASLVGLEGPHRLLHHLISHLLPFLRKSESLDTQFVCLSSFLRSMGLWLRILFYSKS